jgi:hypothetical protein|tara:strand:+ start:40 stop:744 length:705 start_codon:yes stop_codon:yes gene_type:complete
MGQNSTEVAYGFGQLGSVFTNLAYPVYPPKDHVIVAIQFLADNIPTILETETLDTHGPQFPTHQDDQLGADGGPDASFAGVTWAAATGAGTVATGVIPIADVIANNLIKPGQIVIIGDDAAEDIDTGIAVDTAAGNITPVYNGPNKHWMEVVSISGGTYGTSLVVKEVGTPVSGVGVAEIDHIDAANQLYFLDEYHGAGGTTIEGVTFPKGVTIYGRWTEFKPATGGVICYFGK